MAKTMEERAWEIYCEETAGDLDARDSWDQLPVRVQEIYLNKARMDGFCVSCED